MGSCVAPRFPDSRHRRCSAISCGIVQRAQPSQFRSATVRDWCRKLWRRHPDSGGKLGRQRWLRSFQRALPTRGAALSAICPETAILTSTSPIGDAMQEQVAGRLWSISARFAQRLRILVVGALCAAQFNCIILAAEQRPFTIEDSIELSYFVRPVLWSVNQEPSTEPVVSPDGKQILVITQKGILAKNKIQSSIWILERKAIKDFGEKTSRARPQPRMIASFMAAANTPIISDVRWLDDSARVAFLARVDDGTSQLFISNAVTGKIRQMTHARQSVSAYDVRGQTIAYTTLDDTSTVPAGGEDLVDVTGKNLFTLLWSNRPNRERDESLLVTVPNTLHIVSHGKELQLDLQFEGKPLKLFFPILSLSPNEKFLITVAPVTHIPAQWKEYQPRFGYEDLRIDPGNKWVISPENAWRPSQFVKIDVHSGHVTPLIDAPAARSLFQIFPPKKALWSPDSRTVLLCNTFLPLT